MVKKGEPSPRAREELRLLYDGNLYYIKYVYNIKNRSKAVI